MGAFMSTVLSLPERSGDRLSAGKKSTTLTAANPTIVFGTCDCSQMCSAPPNIGHKLSPFAKRCVVCAENCGRPIALDLFSGAGGVAYGLRKAGFCVLGVDIYRQRRYAGCRFVQADALNPPFDLSRFDLIWASPPCQPHTALKTMHNAKAHADLIPATRALLKASGVPYVIENVPGAPLEYSIMLCGTMFGLGVGDAELRRHRIFETSMPMLSPACQHRKRAVIGLYGGHQRNRKRKSNGDKGISDFTIEDGRKAMGVDWMTLAELSQAIPPAYSLFIGKAALALIDEELL